MIGRLSRHPNVVMAFGHGHIGLSTGPITGRIVAKAAEADLPLHRLPLAEMKKIESRITQSVFGVLAADRSVGSRTSFGGTAPKLVRVQARKWLKKLEHEKN